MKFSEGMKITFVDELAKSEFLSSYSINDQIHERCFVDDVATVVCGYYADCVNIASISDDDRTYGKITASELKYFKNFSENASDERITPVGENEKMYVMALLRKLRGQALESSVDGSNFTANTDDVIQIHTEYRPSEYKSINIPWDYIDEEFNYVAMDKCGALYLYQNKPFPGHEEWSVYGDCSVVELTGAIRIDTVGVVWDHSLTKRPA